MAAAGPAPRREARGVRRRATLCGVGLALLGLLLAGAACGGSGSPNAVRNPGFEGGEKPWVSLESPYWGTPFRVSTDQAHSGEASAYLEMRSLADQPLRVFGVSQEISPKRFPARLSGYYFVDTWERGSTVQFLQAVVIVFGADLPGGLENYQVRYALAGLEAPPSEAGQEARWVVVSTEEPRTGEWVRFDLRLAEDFEQLWGALPGKFDFIRLIFAARYEERTPDQPEVVADVYYDDLYAGP